MRISVKAEVADSDDEIAADVDYHTYFHTPTLVQSQ